MKRRTLVKGVAALGSLIGINRVFAADQVPKPGTCRLISQDIAGPYGIAQTPFRANIIERQAGIPFELSLLVLDSSSCIPLEGAVVTIWHANAKGLYSGVNNLMLTAGDQPTGESIDFRGQTFLRGVQKTNADGWVTFNSIFPGWYFPRTTHLHLTVSPPNYGEIATTQLYFPDEVCDHAYAAEQYAHRGPNPVRTDPAKDSPTDGTDEGDLWLNLQRKGDGYAATHTVGVTFYGDVFGELPSLYQQS